jgi:G:T-mismatch repair DNA endonuclease (very short patch repair protein)
MVQVAEKRISWMKGKTHTEESRKKISTMLSGHSVSKETRLKISNTLRGQPFTEERRKNISNGLKGYKASEETKRKLSAAHTGKKRSIEARKRMSEARLGIKLSAETKRRMSIAKKGYKPSDEAMAKLCKALAIKPNKPESALLKLLDQLYPGQWKYTGDYSFMINGKNPDFVNCNGQKKIIELFGDYWHEGDNPQDRADVFSPFGYETLVIWERELKNIDDVASKIQAFHEGA